MENNFIVYMLEVKHTINNKLNNKTILAIYNSYQKAKTSLKINRELDDSLYKEKESYFLTKIEEYDSYIVKFKDESGKIHRFTMSIIPRILY